LNEAKRNEAESEMKMVSEAYDLISGSLAALDQKSLIIKESCTWEVALESVAASPR
jgi:hypothetical protein